MTALAPTELRATCVGSHATCDAYGYCACPCHSPEVSVHRAWFMQHVGIMLCSCGWFEQTHDSAAAAHAWGHHVIHGIRS